MHHLAGHRTQMLPGFGRAKVVAAGEIPLRQLQKILADERPLPLAGIHQPFDNQLTHGLLNGHSAGIELRGQRKLVRQRFIGGVLLADDAFLNFPRYGDVLRRHRPSFQLVFYPAVF